MTLGLVREARARGLNNCRSICLHSEFHVAFFLDAELAACRRFEEAKKRLADSATRER